MFISSGDLTSWMWTFFILSLFFYPEIAFDYTFISNGGGFPTPFFEASTVTFG